jgi:hypothetical protein
MNRRRTNDGGDGTSIFAANRRKSPVDSLRLTGKAHKINAGRYGSDNTNYISLFVLWHCRHFLSLFSRGFTRFIAVVGAFFFTLRAVMYMITVLEGQKGRQVKRTRKRNKPNGDVRQTDGPYDIATYLTQVDWLLSIDGKPPEKGDESLSISWLAASIRAPSKSTVNNPMSANNEIFQSTNGAAMERK